MRRGKLACALSLGALAGCSASPASSTAPYVCLLPFEQRMLVAELFFGRGIAGPRPADRRRVGGVCGPDDRAQFP